MNKVIAGQHALRGRRDALLVEAGLSYRVVTLLNRLLSAYKDIVQ